MKKYIAVTPHAPTTVELCLATVSFFQDRSLPIPLTSASLSTNHRLPSYGTTFHIYYEYDTFVAVVLG